VYNAAVNPLDLVIVGLCLLFAILGVAHGFVRQAVSWIGLVASHLAGVRYHAAAARLLSLDGRYSDEVGYLCVFAAVYLAARIVGILVERWVRSSRLSGTDRLAGGAAGLLKGVLLSVLLVFFLVIFLPRDARLLRESKLAPRAAVAGRWLGHVFPERMAAAFRDRLSASGPPGERPAEARPPAAPHPKNRSRK